MDRETKRRFGQWDAGALLFSGESCAVYQAEPRGAVIKWLKPRAANDPRHHDQFATEIDALTHLEHPNVVKLLHHGEVDNRPYLVLAERGLPLAYLGRLTLRDALYVASEVGRALQAVHKLDRVFRNLAPANVLINDAGEVTLIDFAYCCAPNTSEPGAPAHHNYLSPEQARGELLSPQSDQYGLGLILLELTTGAAAYPAERSAEQLRFIASGLSAGEVRARMAAVGNVQERLTNLVLRALERNPHERFAQMIELIREINRALNVIDVNRDRRELCETVQRVRHQMQMS
ncbi:MAG: protein kinase [Myxococcales bacterium]|nr:protein kinase [Myxococcales bacterium]